MHSATRIVTIVFRFVAISLVLILAYNWIVYLLTPTVELPSSADMNHVSHLRLEGMFRHTLVVLLSAVGLFLTAPFWGRLVTRGSEG
jgi:polyferredoxin